jgi:hypothetical protein
MLGTLYKFSLLTLECQFVIALRMMKLAQGGAAASAESQRMWSEKAFAAMRFGPAFLAGGSLDTMLDNYTGVVRANHSRLRGRKRRQR